LLVKKVGWLRALVAQNPHIPKRSSVAMDVTGPGVVGLALTSSKYRAFTIGMLRETRRRRRKDTKRHNGSRNVTGRGMMEVGCKCR